MGTNYDARPHTLPLRPFRGICCLICFIIPCATSQPVCADMIYLKNNNPVECVVLEVNDETVVARVKTGKIYFTRGNIEKIEEWSPEENTLLREGWDREKEVQRKLDAMRLQQSAERGVRQREQRSEKKTGTPPAPVPAREEHSDIAPRIPESSETKYVRREIPNFYGRTNLFQIKRRESWKFYMYIPPDYTETKKWPLFIGVHGSGGTGKHAIDWWRTFAYQKGFILVCPNFEKGYRRLSQNTDMQLIEIIEQVKGDFRVDEEKILLSGFSAGAQYAERFALRHPKYITAVALMGAGSYDLPDRSRCKDAAHITFLVMAGAADTMTRRMVAEQLTERLKKYNCEVQLRIFPIIGHSMEGEVLRCTIDLLDSL